MSEEFENIELDVNEETLKILAERYVLDNLDPASANVFDKNSENWKETLADAILNDVMLDIIKLYIKEAEENMSNE